MWKDPKWRLLVFRRTMLHFSTAIVICAVVAGIYQNRTYFTFAAVAAGVILLARAWWTRCRRQDGRTAPRIGAQVPYSLRGNKPPRRHKPAFLMTSADFDDDLTPQTIARDEDFSEAECFKAQMCAYIVSGVLLIAASFIQ